MSDNVCVALVGAGYWGKKLLPKFVSNRNSLVRVICDIHAGHRAEMNQTYPDIPTSESIDNILSDPSIAAIVLATPPATHFPLARKVINAGKHVWIEKPLALRIDEGRDLVELSQCNKTVLFVDHTFLYDPAIRKIRELIDGGELGSVHHIYSQRLNLGQLRSDVNAWWNLAPHDVSIQLFLLGETGRESVSAIGRAFLQPDIEDVVVANLSWRSGVVGTIHVSWLDPHKTRQLTVVGTRRMVVYDDMSEHKLTVYEKGFDRVPRLGERMDYDSLSPPHFRPRQGAVVMPYCPVREPLTVEVEHFLECILTNRKPETDAQHARAVVSVLEAAQASLKQGGMPRRLQEMSR